ISTRALGEAVNRFPSSTRGPLPSRRAHCPPSRARVLIAAAIAVDFELLNQLPKLRGHLRQLLGRFLSFCHTCGSIVRRLRHTGDVVRNLSGSLGCFRYVAFHLVCGGALLLNRGGDNARDVIDLIDHSADRSDRLDGSFGVLLNRGDLLADVFRSFRRLLGQFLDLVRYDGKAFYSFTGYTSSLAGVLLNLING